MKVNWQFICPNCEQYIDSGLGVNQKYSEFGTEKAIRICWPCHNKKGE